VSLRIVVQFLSIYRSLAGEAQCTVDLAAGATVGDLLIRLSERYGPVFQRAVLASEGRALAADVTVLRNGENIALGQGVATPLCDGDQVTLLLAISGG
jgi:MoaD family protein